MPWIERSLRGTRVYARTKPDGTLAMDPSGRVEVRYRLESGARAYHALARNLEAVPDAKVVSEMPGKVPTLEGGPVPGREPVVIYTDGGAVPNPGPMGVGVVILRGNERQEIGEYLGTGTNNIAELTAIERALDALGDADRERQILVHADSAYAIGVVSGAFKAKKNLELVARLREKAQRFPQLRFVKVAGHAGVVENERCDELAAQAILLGTRGRV
jgi:ribonuclease HI